MKISDFFLVTSVSAGEHPLVKRSGALQGDEIFIYLVDIRFIIIKVQQLNPFRFIETKFSTSTVAVLKIY